jgi:hypothetical protein
MIKETFKQMIDSVPFNLDRAKTACLSSKQIARVFHAETRQGYGWQKT